MDFHPQMGVALRLNSVNLPIFANSNFTWLHLLWGSREGPCYATQCPLRQFTIQLLNAQAPWLVLQPLRLTGSGYRPVVNQLQPTGQIQPLPALLNNILLEHSHTHTLRYCLWLLLLYKGGAEWLHQELESQQSRIKLLTIWSFQGKTLLWT